MGLLSNARNTAARTSGSTTRTVSPRRSRPNLRKRATLTSVLASLIEKFHGSGATGYDSKDLVVLLGPRIVAVVRSGRDGRPEVTTFET